MADRVGEREGLGRPVADADLTPRRDRIGRVEVEERLRLALLSHEEPGERLHRLFAEVRISGVVRGERVEDELEIPQRIEIGARAPLAAARVRRDPRIEARRLLDRDPLPGQGREDRKRHRIPRKPRCAPWRTAPSIAFMSSRWLLRRKPPKPKASIAPTLMFICG